ncbi:sensor histidine kinase [Sphingomonas echinoides]|uniref:histidine kinase n=1 Tax=Sphingomonas echinoides TaxID=59803 RepID=A0ABU4PN01_9SPHN|nr:HAMP domain-containing sensor histidine kinase [Sphingomonas echinoides]MDX5985528.1 HAMP domain-containing sensor histidine kinase [Sphingomonas echinoides]
MRKPRASAAYRIAFTYSAAFTLAILLLGVAIYIAADAQFRRQQDAALVDEASALAHEYNEGDLPEIRHAIARREGSNTINAYGYALFDRTGHRVGGGLNTRKPPVGLQDIVFVDPVEGADHARAYATDLTRGLRLVVARDSESLEGIDQTIVLIFGGAFVLVIGLSVFGALLLGGYLQRRLDGISGVARAIMAGDMAQRVPLSDRRDEFDAVGSALNTMLDRIGQLMDNLRQVSSDVAHDLRTPLLRLRNQLEQVGQVPGAAERAIEQGDAVLALFAALLRIAEVEGGALARSFVATDMTLVVTEIAESYAPAFADSGRTLGWSVAPGITVLGDRELIAQALINLLDNALLHTPPGTPVAVSLEADAHVATVSVADAGPGVPPGDHARILQRFARGEASRTTPGNGLGLSLVAAVTAAHGGTIAVDDNRPGLRVTLRIPRVDAA